MHATRLLQALPPSEIEAVLSAGGPGTGGTWTAGHKHVLELMPNAVWRAATLDRLRLWKMPAGAVCQLRRQTPHGDRTKVEGRVVCGKLLDDDQHHPHRCEHGAAKLRPHESLKHRTSEFLRRAEAFVDIERVIPELADYAWDRKEKKWKPRVARMDIVAQWPGSSVQWWLDVSVRAASAIKHQRCEGATMMPGAAAAAGEKEKRQRYGDAVRAIVFETQGRLGNRGQRTLKELAAAASTSSRRISPRVLGQWRLEMERAVIAAVADSLVRAAGASDRQYWPSAQQQRESSWTASVGV